MKKILVGAVTLGSLTVAGVAMAGLPAATGVNGSLHDMTKIITVGNPADSMGRVCVFCHTPHNAQSNMGSGSNAPLWNRAAGTATYDQYVWVTPLNIGNDPAVPFGPQSGADALIGPSRLCMSCHDGTIAVDQHGPARAQAGRAGATMADINSGRANLGGDLTKTHPIGFDYTAIRGVRNTAATGGVGDVLTGDTEIVDPAQKFATAVTLSNTPGTYNSVTRGGTKAIKDVLFQGNIMTCASCHEVHNKENVIQDDYKANDLGLSGSPNYFLYAKQTDSLICLSCHIK